MTATCWVAITAAVMNVTTITTAADLACYFSADHSMALLLESFNAYCRKSAIADFLLICTIEL